MNSCHVFTTLEMFSTMEGCAFGYCRLTDGGHCLNAIQNPKSEIQNGWSRAIVLTARDFVHTIAAASHVTPPCFAHSPATSAPAVRPERTVRVLRPWAAPVSQAAAAPRA